MKKNYTFVEIKVISLDNADVITASGAKQDNTIVGNTFDLGGYGTQPYT